MKILSIGNVFESITIMVDSFCKTDGETVANKLNSRISGATLVVSTIAAFLEESANVIFKAKMDTTLNKYVNLLISRGVNVSILPANETNTLITVYDKNQCRQCYSYSPNGIGCSDLKEIDFAQYDLVFFCSLPYSALCDLYISNSTINSTCTVVLPNGFIPTYFCDKQLQMKSTFLFLNEGELTNLFDLDDNYDLSIQNLIKELNIFDTNVIITRGKKGIAGIVNKMYFEHPVTEIAKIVHPGGAGDSFATGFMISLLRGMSLSECCNVGHLCASKMLSVFNTEEFLRGNNEIRWKI